MFDGWFKDFFMVDFSFRYWKRSYTWFSSILCFADKNDFADWNASSKVVLVNIVLFTFERVEVSWISSTDVSSCTTQFKWSTFNKSKQVTAKLFQSADEKEDAFSSLQISVSVAFHWLKSLSSMYGNVLIIALTTSTRSSTDTGKSIRMCWSIRPIGWGKGRKEWRNKRRMMMMQDYRESMIISGATDLTWSQKRWIN